MVTYCLAQNGIHKTFPFEGCKSFVFVLCFALNKTETHFFLYLLGQNYVLFLSYCLGFCLSQKSIICHGIVLLNLLNQI